MSVGTHVLVIGALHVDEIANADTALVPRASNPVRWRTRPGGVAANVARQLAREAQSMTPAAAVNTRRTRLLAAVGDDAVATALEQHLCRSGVEVDCCRRTGQRTGRYVAVLDSDGELYVGLADLAIAESLQPLEVQQALERDTPDIVVVDANLSAACLAATADMTRGLIALTVSPAKARRLLPLAGRIELLFCNRREAAAVTGQTEQAPARQLVDGLSALGFERIVMTDGPAAVQVVDGATRESLPTPEIRHTRSVNGAGDALAAATIAGWSFDARGAAASDGLARAVADRGLTAAANLLLEADSTTPERDP